MPYRSRLLDIPVELRVHILELALASEGTKDINGDDVPKRVVIIARFSKRPHLLAVCRQLRGEASDIYYGNHIFEIRTHWNAVPWLRSRTKEARNRLTTLRLVMVAFQGRSTKQLMERIAGQIRSEGLGEHIVLEILRDNSVTSPCTAGPFFEWKKSFDGL